MRRLLLSLAAAGMILGGAVGCQCSSSCAPWKAHGGHLCEGGLLGGSHTHGVCDCEEGPEYGCSHGHGSHGSGYCGAAAPHALPHGGAAPAPMPSGPEQLHVLPKASGE